MGRLRKHDPRYSGSALVHEMTSNAAPLRVIVGHESPVESIVIFEGDRPFYATYDYGTVQTLDLSDQDKSAIERNLADLKLTAATLRRLPDAPRR